MDNDKEKLAIDERVGTDAERAEILLVQLAYIQQQFNSFQRFLSDMQGVIESYPGGSFAERNEPIVELIDDIGWADKCKDSLAGQVLVSLRAIDSKLIEALELLGVKAKNLDEEIGQKIAAFKNQIRQKASERAIEL